VLSENFYAAKVMLFGKVNKKNTENHTNSEKKNVISYN
jgi:hypothetical protein